jgi:guanylate kinase
MIKTKKQGELIVISGPSGVGKGSICKRLLRDNPNMWMSISTTTRSIRANEKEGENYYFITKEQFEEKIKQGELIEYAIVHNNQYYGTPKSDVTKHLNMGIDVILEIDINGALQIKETFPQAIFIFILPPSMKELKRRLEKRGTESKEKIFERFKTAYKEINAITKYNYVVVNDDKEVTTKKISAIITAEKCRVDRIEELELNTIAEYIHEDLVDIKQDN